jgi:precorrin-6Y C5,15-methyltransferase (decarboxylating)
VSAWLQIVGVGEGGVGELPARVWAVVDGAETVLGPERLLAGLRTPSPTLPTGGRVPTVPVARAVTPTPESTLPLVGRAGEGEQRAQTLIPWQSPLDTMLQQILSLRGIPTAILATGDPMWFGIGATLSKHFSPDEFEVHPHPSAFQLAAARLRWPLQNIATISLHGRAVETLYPHILPGNRILTLTGDRNTVAAVINILKACGYGQSLLTVLESLGGSAERITTASAVDFIVDVSDFYTLAIDCIADPGAALLPPHPGLPDNVFLSDGQLTKREVRAATLAKLAPYPGALLWDVGAGCGSVAIEWMRAARTAKAIAFERDAGRLEMISANAGALGVPTLKIVAGELPQTLAGQPAPDAIFLGGDVGSEALFEACWAALKPGGRLVANAVTLDGEQALYQRQERLGGELARIDVSVLDRVGGHRVLRPRMAVTQWLVIKP